MTYVPKHRVILFALDNGALKWDDDDQAIVERIVTFENIEDAERMMREAILSTGEFNAANLAPSVECFARDDLAGYLRALNAKAHLLEEYPEDGHWISSLTEDLSHWADMDVDTPHDLAAYLDGAFEREMEKQAMCA